MKKLIVLLLALCLAFSLPVTGQTEEEVDWKLKALQAEASLEIVRLQLLQCQMGQIQNMSQGLQSRPAQKALKDYQSDLKSDDDKDKKKKKKRR